MKYPFTPPFIQEPASHGHHPGQEDLRAHRYLDTTNLCSHLQKKLFEPEGEYYPIWKAMQEEEEITAAVRNRQLHIYRNGKKILILAGKAQPKIIREDRLNELIR